jgi:hypothetical protein
MGRACYTNDPKAERTRSRKSSRKDAKDAKFGDHGRNHSYEFSASTLGGFAPWREKLRDLVTALPGQDFVMKVASPKARKNLEQ